MIKISLFLMGVGSSALTLLVNALQEVTVEDIGISRLWYTERELTEAILPYSFNMESLTREQNLYRGFIVVEASFMKSRGLLLPLSEIKDIGVLVIHDMPTEEKTEPDEVLPAHFVALDLVGATVGMANVAPHAVYGRYEDAARAVLKRISMGDILKKIPIPPVLL